MATTCYCEACHAQGRAPMVKHTYTRKYMQECLARSKATTAYEAARLESANRAAGRGAPPPDDTGWWNAEGAPTA